MLRWPRLVRPALRCGEKRYCSVAKSGTSMRRNGVKLGAAELRCCWCCGAAVVDRWVWRLAQHPCRFSSGPRVGLQLRPAVLRSTDDVKADNRDGFHRRGGSSGAKANNHGTLVAKRGAIPLMAGGGGAERAHLAELRIQCARRGAAARIWWRFTEMVVWAAGIPERNAGVPN